MPVAFKKLTILALALCATGSLSLAGPNPAVPAETAQVAFLVGEWDCRTRFSALDGYFPRDRRKLLALAQGP